MRHYCESRVTTALLASILGASLLGSVHCAAMCGGFVCLYAPDARDVRAHMMYHVGRLSSYIALGVLAGLVGASVDQLGSAVGYARLAPIVGGILLITWGLVAVYRALGRSTWAPRRKDSSPPLAQQLITGARGRSPHTRAYLIGLASTLLPCGWLYAFAATAAGTGTVLSAIAVMAVFWVGTLPVMTAAGVLIQRMTGPMRARLPLVTAAAMIVVGLVAVSGRLSQLSLNHNTEHASHR